MLKVTRLSAWYGEAQVLRDISLEVNRGEVVTLAGRNGAGKTTLLRCIMGLHPQMQGDIELDGTDLTRLPPNQRARQGLGWVQDDRGIYAGLSVEENLKLPPVTGPDAWSLERIYEFFPNLKERRRSPGSKLSGGEQQMLAIARVLRMGARLLLLDEPTEGLAPVFVHYIGEVLNDVKSHGVTMLLVEQNLHFATTVADRHYLLAQGQVVQMMDNGEVKARKQELLEHLGV